MFLGLLVITIVVWSAVFAYLLRLIPPSGQRGRRGRPGWAVGAVAAAMALSVACYRLGTAQRVRDQAARYYHAGIDDRARGNLQQAEEELQKAVSLDPGRTDAQRQLEALRTEHQAEHREQTRETVVAPVPAASGAPANPGAAKALPEERRGVPGERIRPAAHQPSPFEITRYLLAVRLDPAAHTLEATATLRVRSRGKPLQRLDFSLGPEFTPVRAAVAGAPVPFRHVHDLLTLTPAAPLARDLSAAVTVEYRYAGAPVIKGGAGLLSTRGSYFLSECRWYPATGELDFRAPVRVEATVPNGYTAVSVGALRGKEVGPRETTFHWGTERLASMVSLACARYVERGASVPLNPAAAEPQRRLTVTCYTYPGHADRAAAFLKEAAAIVRYYEGRFGPYPYEKLGVVEIPLFPGGYGTTSFVMLIDQSFAARKIDREFLAHEIAHQWWGNSVFPQGLGAAWLTEAFANYSAWLYAAAIQGNPRILEKRVALATSRYFSAADRKGDQAIAETDPYLQIGAREEIIYEKGAVVLHMLRRQVGDAAFFRGMRSYADRYRFGKATIADFQQVMERVSGQPLGWFFDQWLGRTGGMSLTYDFTTERDDAQRNQAVLRVNQAAPAYRGRMKVTLDVENSVQQEEIELAGEQNLFRFPVRGKLTGVLLDPDHCYLMRPPRWVVPETSASR